MSRFLLVGLVLSLLAAFALWAAAPDGDLPPPPGVAEAPAREPATALRAQHAEQAPVERDVVAPAGPHAADDDTRGAVRIRALSRGTKEPAPAVLVEMARGDGERTAEFHVAGETNAQGELLVPSLRPGNVAFRIVGWSKAKWCRVFEGSVAELTLDVGQPWEVHGRVEDAAGTRVPGAAIWLSSGMAALDGSVVGKSDVRGEFQLRSYGRRLVAARTPRGTSKPMPAWGPFVEEPIVLRLVDGGSLEGQVVDTQGRGVAGARVTIGGADDLAARMLLYQVDSPAMTAKVLDTFSQLASPPPVTTTTDRSGRFTARSCPLGDTVPIRVDADGFVRGHESVAIPADGHATTRVVLLEGAAVEGTVRDESGAPCAGVLIGAHDHGSTVSSDDGQFAFEGMTPGRILLQIGDRWRGGARIELQAEAGERLRWDPILKTGRAIRGVVVDDTGKALQGWGVYVAAQGPDARYSRRVETDARGRFIATNCEDAEYELTVQAGWMPFHVRKVGGIRPDNGEVEIVVAQGQKPSAWVTGILKGPTGESLACGVSVHAEYESIGQQMSAGLSAGPFRVGPLRPGTYRLVFSTEEHAPVERSGLVLEPDQELDLGVLWAEAMGSLEVIVGGPVPQDCRIQVVPLSKGRAYKTELQPGDTRLENLAAGEYTLTAWSQGHGLARRTVRIHSGRLTTTHLTLVPGVTQRFRITGGRRQDLMWRNADGTLLFHESVRSDKATIELERALPTGAYRLDVTSVLSRAGQVDFVVEGGAKPKTIEIELRRVSAEEWLRLLER